MICPSFRYILSSVQKKKKKKKTPTKTKHTLPSLKNQHINVKQIILIYFTQFSFIIKYRFQT